MTSVKCKKRGSQLTRKKKEEQNCGGGEGGRGGGGGGGGKGGVRVFQNTFPNGLSAIGRLEQQLLISPDFSDRSALSQ